MISDLMKLTDIVVTRETRTLDGMGGYSTSTTTKTILKGVIWQSNSNDRFISDKITKSSTHILAIEYGDYTFTNSSTISDIIVTQGGRTFNITGNDDNVFNNNELVLVGLEQLT